jgi:hypothetical protein
MKGKLPIPLIHLYYCFGLSISSRVRISYFSHSPPLLFYLFQARNYRRLRSQNKMAEFTTQFPNPCILATCLLLPLESYDQLEAAVSLLLHSSWFLDHVLSNLHHYSHHILKSIINILLAVRQGIIREEWIRDSSISNEELFN